VDPTADLLKCREPKSDSLISSLKLLSERDRNDYIRGLTPAEFRELLAVSDAEYKADPWLWLCEEVVTQDEATQVAIPWPDKAYLKDLFWLFQNERIICIPKSRRMMVSWGMAAWAVFNARYSPHHAIFIQSETEEKAAFITDKRCQFIENNLREPLLRRKYKAIKTHQGLVGRITYEATDSYIWAIPQGDDVIRSFTFSILIMDESEFQPEGIKALGSALPTAEKNAQLIIASTSNGPQGVLADICRAIGFSKFL
jgi:hypothetical protein